MDKVKIVSFSDVTISEEEILFDIIELWNHEVGFIFPFYRELLIQKIFECKYFCKECSFLAYKNDKLIGFIISKIYDNDEVMEKYINTGWISLLYVTEEFRNLGIGSNLLKKTEEMFVIKNIETIMVGADYDNFFPGIPSNFSEFSHTFFEKRGYKLGSIDYDMIGYKINLQKKKVELNNFVIRYAQKGDKDKVLTFLKKNFYGRWYYEALEYFDYLYEEKTYLILLKEEQVIGFIRINRYNSKKISYNVNWNRKFNMLYGFGPLGIDKDFRKQGLSRTLIEQAINDALDEGAEEIIIDWTSLIEYYKKFNFEIWNEYQHCTKKIK